MSLNNLTTYNPLTINGLDGLNINGSPFDPTNYISKIDPNIQTISGSLDAGLNKIKSGASPSGSDDLTNKLYVDTQNNSQDIVIATKASTTYVDTQNNAQDLVIATKASTTYVDTQNNAQDLVIATKASTTYVDTQNNAQDLVIATKASTTYVDSQDALKLNLTGGTLTGTLVMGSNKITSSYTPVNAEDLTRKGYVDTSISNLASAVANTYLDKITGSTQNMNGEINGPAYTASGRLAVWNGGSQFYNSRVEISGEDYIIQRDDSVNPIEEILRYDLSLNKWIYSEQTASRVAIFDVDKGLVSSTTSTTTLGYLDIGSSLVGLLGAKSNLIGGNTFSGDQVINSGSLSISSRFLGTPDGSVGNFWMGLRGTGSEADRLAISINGNQTTGVVDRVIIAKTLRLSQPTANRVLTVDTNGDVVSSTVTPATLAFLDATSSVQTQLDARVLKVGDTMTGDLIINKTGRGWRHEIVGGVRLESFINATAGWIGTFTNHPLYFYVNNGGDAMSISTSGVVRIADLTADRVLTTNGSKELVSSSITTTTLGFLDATSSVQTQLNARVLKAGDTMTGIFNVNIANTYASRASNPLPSNLIAKSNSQRLYMGAYYTAGAGACSTIQSSDYYPDGGADKDHGADLLINPLGGVVGIGASSPGLNWADTAIPNAKLTILGGAPLGTTGKARISLGADSKHYSAIEAQHVGSGSTTIAFMTAESAFVNGSNPTTRLFINQTGQVGIGTDTGLSTYKLYVNGTCGLAGQVDIGVGGNTTPNIKFASSNSHVDNNVGEAYLFTAFQGHIGIQRNTLRNASTACLVLGTTATEVSQVISVKSDNSAYMPMNYDASRHSFNNGPVNIAGLTPFVVPNNYMATGSLTIGGNQDYGGGSNWSSSTAGLLMECKNNTEIAIHDYGDRVVSFMYYSGNRLTIGRDMFWGATPTTFATDVTVNGSIKAYANAVGAPSIITSENASSADSSYAVFNCRANTGGGSYWFHNSSTRTADGGVNTATIRNDVGDLRLQGSGANGITVQATTGTCFHSAGDNSYMRYGPNSSWSSYLHVGATTNKVGSSETAQVITTNGNLHLDAGYDRDIYLGLYAYNAGRVGNNYIYGETCIATDLIIGSTSLPTGVLEVYSTVADYSNSVLVRTPWASVTLDNTQISGGRKWSLLTGGPGAGVGVGNFGIFDITGGNYKFSLDSTGRISLGNNNAFTHVGVMGGVVGAVSGGPWTANSNGILITEEAPIPSTSGLYLGHQGGISYLTSLAPGVVWRDMQFYAGNYYLHTNGVLNVYLLGGVAGWITSSDEKEKEDIQDLKTSTSLKRVLGLKPKHYRRKYYESETPISDEVKHMRHVGFLAQEVQQTNPHCVSQWCNDKAKCDDDDGVRLGVNYNDYTIHLVGGMQEQQKQLETMSQRCAILEERNQILEEHARKQEKDLSLSLNTIQEYQRTNDLNILKMASLISQLLKK